MRNLTATVLVIITLLVGTPALGVGGEILTVDGVEYVSYKLSGPTYHWESPDTNPTTAYFALRDQTWQGNGSEKLPCPGGIHWISNENTLNVSHCLVDTTTTEVPKSTTTTTTPGTSTTTTQPVTTSSSSVPLTTVDTTVPPLTPTTPAPTTTVFEPTTTSSVTPGTSVSTTLPPTTVVVAVTTPPVPTVVTTLEEPTKELPETGSTTWTMAIVAGMMVLIGGTATKVSRRRI